MFEHLEAGVEGYEGEGKHRRECVLKLLNQVNADDAIQLNSYVKFSDLVFISFRNLFGIFLLFEIVVPII
mgnify:CR=1 FL=1